MATFSDDFNRSDEDLTTPWVQNSMGDGGTMGIDTNKVTRTAAGGGGALETAHHSSDFGPDCQVELDYDGGNPLLLFLRLINPGSTSQCYYAEIVLDGTCYIYRQTTTHASPVLLDEGIVASLPTGTRFRLKAEGTTISLYHTAGTWTEIASGTDGTLTAAGKAGVGGLTFATGDNFSVADLAAGLPAYVPARRVPKRLAGPAQLSNVAATKYTAPAGYRAMIRSVHVSNPTGAAIDFTLSIGTDAAGTRLYDGYSISAGDYKRWFLQEWLNPGEVIQAFASTGAALVLTIDGFERPAG